MSESEWMILKGKEFELKRTLHKIEHEHSESMKPYLKPEGHLGEWFPPEKDQHTKGFFDGLHVIRQFVQGQLLFIQSEMEKFKPTDDLFEEPK